MEDGIEQTASLLLEMIRKTKEQNKEKKRKKEKKKKRKNEINHKFAHKIYFYSNISFGCENPVGMDGS